MFYKCTYNDPRIHKRFNYEHPYSGNRTGATALSAIVLEEPHWGNRTGTNVLEQPHYGNRTGTTAL